MLVENLLKIIESDFYIGVPDSQLKALCDCLMSMYGTDPHHHIIAANEGNCVALAAGYHLATGKIPVVYMQNSGEGNIVNPVTSLLSNRVYSIPVIFIIGWRGEPGIPDEPQHSHQGEITLKLLEDLGIDSFVLGMQTLDFEVMNAMDKFRHILVNGGSVAFVIRKNALSYAEKIQYENKNTITRENAIKHIIMASGDDPVISTTGKASRELYELRKVYGQDHKRDFLTVGSMGHSSSIALGIALNKPNARIWCLDGDGAALMHMGSMAVLGTLAPKNMVHIIINNGAHETVGGMPTVASQIDLSAIAKACGYPYAVSVNNLANLDMELEDAKQHHELRLIEVKCSLGARQDLGRPTTTTLENKNCFMRYLETL